MANYEPERDKNCADCFLCVSSLLMNVSVLCSDLPQHLSDYNIVLLLQRGYKFNWCIYIHVLMISCAFILGPLTLPECGERPSGANHEGSTC